MEKKNESELNVNKTSHKKSKSKGDITILDES